MIIRNISNISGRAIDDSITSIQTDPHGKFVAVYYARTRSILLIDTNEFAIQLNRNLVTFHNQKRYQSKLAVSSINQIHLSQRYRQICSIFLVIGKKYRDRQFLAFSIFQDLIVHQIFQTQEKRLTTKQVYNCKISPDYNDISRIHFHLNKLYVTQCSGYYYSILQFNFGYQRWIPGDKKIIKDGQYKRLAMYNNENFNDPFCKKIVKNKKLILPKEQPMKAPEKFQHMESFHEIMTRVGLKYQNNQFEMFEKVQGSQEQQNYIIVYQGPFNSLILTYFDYYEKEWIEKLIIGPQEPQIVHKTSIFGKDKMDQNLDEDQDQDSNSLQQQTEQVILNPWMYCASKCQKYIIQNINRKYKILSKDLDWKIVHVDSREPFVNPFYQFIQKRVMLNMLIQFGQPVYQQIYKYISENFHFILTLYPTVKIGINQEFQVIQLQLLVVDKKENNLKNTRQQLMDQIMLDFNKMQSQKPIKEKKKQTNFSEDMSQQILRRKKAQEEKRFNQFYDGEISQQLYQSNYDYLYDFGGEEKQHKSKRQLSKNQRKVKTRTFQDKILSSKIRQSSFNVKNESSQNTDSFSTIFPICRLEYVKQIPVVLRWVNETEVVFFDRLKRLHYLTIHPNIIYPTIQKIYCYLYWANLRDSLEFQEIEECNAIINNFEQEYRQFSKSYEDQSFKREAYQQNYQPEKMQVEKGWGMNETDDRRQNDGQQFSVIYEMDDSEI